MFNGRTACSYQRLRRSPGADAMVFAAERSASMRRPFFRFSAIHARAHGFLASTHSMIQDFRYEPTAVTTFESSYGLYGSSCDRTTHHFTLYFSRIHIVISVVRVIHRTIHTATKFLVSVVVQVYYLRACTVPAVPLHTNYSTATSTIISSPA